MRSLRRRVHFAHFSPRSSRRKYSAVELSAVSSRDIFVDALYFPSIHRIVAVQYSLQIRSPSHTRESIRVACFLSHAKQIYALAVLTKLLCFPFPRKFFWKFASDTGASNRGQQFSDEIKKKKRKRTNSLSVCERSGSRGPLFLDRLTSLSFHLSQPRTSRGDITTLLRSSRSIPRPLTIFISPHTAFLRSSPGSSYLLPSRSSSPFLSPILPSCQNSFTPVALSWSRRGRARKIDIAAGKEKDLPLSTCKILLPSLRGAYDVHYA